MAGRRAALEILADDYPTRDGTCIRDYVHVNDLAEAHVLGLKYLQRRGDSQVFNLGTGNGHSVREIVQVVERVTRRLSTPSRGERPGHYLSNQHLTGLAGMNVARELGCRRCI